MIRELEHSERGRYRDQVKSCLAKIHQAGVIHRDVRELNVLVHPSTHDMMIIDFERASLLKRPRQALGSLAPNKRGRTEGDVGNNKSRDGSARDSHEGDIGQDLAMVQGMWAC